MKVTIREASTQDASALSYIVITLAYAFLEYPDRPETTKSYFEEVKPEAFRTMLSDSRFRFHVATVDDAIIGFIGMRDNCHLMHMFVSEDFQGRGVSTQLWHRARKESISIAKCNQFTVNASRQGVAVYRHFGFMKRGEETSRDGVMFTPMSLSQT